MAPKLRTWGPGGTLTAKSQERPMGSEEDRAPAVNWRDPPEHMIPDEGRSNSARELPFDTACKARLSTAAEDALNWRDDSKLWKAP